MPHTAEHFCFFSGNSQFSYKFYDAGVHGQKSPRFECHVEVQGTGELILVMNESCDKKILVCGCIMTTNDITKYQNGSVNLDFQATEKLHIRSMPEVIFSLNMLHARWLLQSKCERSSVVELQTCLVFIALFSPNTFFPSCKGQLSVHVCKPRIICTRDSLLQDK